MRGSLPVFTLRMKRFGLILGGTSAFLALWFYFTFSRDSPVKNQFETVQWILLLAPLEALIAFGLYSVLIIIKRLIFFPECPAASDSLQEEMKKARLDLTSKGFKFEESKKDK